MARHMLQPQQQEMLNEIVVKGIIRCARTDPKTAERSLMTLRKLYDYVSDKSVPANLRSLTSHIEKGMDAFISDPHLSQKKKDLYSGIFLKVFDGTEIARTFETKKRGHRMYCKADSLAQNLAETRKAVDKVVQRLKFL